MIVLASASPRRRALLAAAGLDFRIEPADVDETPPAGALPDAVARELALRKARRVAARHPRESLWVLGSDTLVVLGADAEARLLGKPENDDAAREMLAALSSTRHRVITGVAVVAPKEPRRPASPVAGPIGAEFVGSETTWVTMRTIRGEEIEAYVRSGEWRDKAGGYAIQETADRFVTDLDGGGFDNVVGLPVRLALELLARSGAPGLPPSLAPPGGGR